MTMGYRHHRTPWIYRSSPPWVGRLIVTIMCLGNLAIVAACIKTWGTLPPSATPGAWLIVCFNGPYALVGLFCAAFKPEMFE